jgi:glucokinase
MSLAIGVDLGGTKIAAGVVDEAGQILDERRQPTPTSSAEAVVDAMVSMIRELQAAHPVTAVGIGAPCFIAHDRDYVMFTANLPIRDIRLGSAVAEKTNLPTIVENDANAAAWAEFQFGAARGATDMVLITLGTGLGGGLVANGELIRGAFGVAAEVGHIEMVHGGRRCGCGLVGCWEAYASGSGFVRTARELAAERPTDATVLLALGDGTAEGVQGMHVTEAARKGDPVATEAFRVTGEYIGRGLAILGTVLDPSTYVIGGGLSDASDLFMHHVTAAFAEHISARAHRPQAKFNVAVLGNAAGIVGAADLARR